MIKDTGIISNIDRHREGIEWNQTTNLWNKHCAQTKEPLGGEKDQIKECNFLLVVAE